MDHLNIKDAFKNIDETMQKVSQQGERIILEYQGKEAAVLVPLEDLHLIEEVEDQMDLQEAIESLRDPQRIPYDEVRKKMGLS